MYVCMYYYCYYCYYYYYYYYYYLKTDLKGMTISIFIYLLTWINERTRYYGILP